MFCTTITPEDRAYLKTMASPQGKQWGHTRSRPEPQLGKARAEPLELELEVDSGAAHYFLR